MNLFNGYVSQIIGLILLAFFGFLGLQAKNLYRKYVNTEVKQAICRTAVRFVEQVFTDIHGHDKLVEAMKKASEMLANYGIEISDEELVAMLEAAVNEFNDQFNKNAVYHISATSDSVTDASPYYPPTYEEIRDEFK